MSPCWRFWPAALLLLALTAPAFAAEPVAPVATPVTPETATEQPPVAAPDSPSAEPSPPTPPPQLRLPGIRFLDRTHGFFSRSLEGFSDRIDAFFGDERIFEEASGTYARLSGSCIYGRSGHLSFDGLARVRVNLTNLSDKLHLLVASDETLENDSDITTGERLAERIDNSDPVAALQIVLQETRRWDVRLQPGIKFRAPVDPFVKLRMRRLQQLSEKWLLRATLTPAWYDSSSWQLRSGVDLDHTIGKKSLLRFSTNANWDEGNKKNVILQQSIFYAFQLTPVVAVGTAAGVSFDTTPWVHDTSYFANIRLRRNLHRSWIFLETKPQIAFERARGFRPDPSLVLTLEMLFGERYL